MLKKFMKMGALCFAIMVICGAFFIPQTAFADDTGGDFIAETQFNFIAYTPPSPTPDPDPVGPVAPVSDAVDSASSAGVQTGDVIF